MQSRSVSPSLRAMARMLRMLASVMPCTMAGNAGSCKGEVGGGSTSLFPPSLPLSVYQQGKRVTYLQFEVLK